MLTLVKFYPADLVKNYNAIIPLSFLAIEIKLLQVNRKIWRIANCYYHMSSHTKECAIVCEVKVDLSLSRQARSPVNRNNLTVRVLKVVKDENVTFKLETDGVDGSKVCQSFISLKYIELK